MVEADKMLSHAWNVDKVLVDVSCENGHFHTGDRLPFSAFIPGYTYGSRISQ